MLPPTEEGVNQQRDGADGPIVLPPTEEGVNQQRDGTDGAVEDGRQLRQTRVLMRLDDGLAADGVLQELLGAANGRRAADLHRVAWRQVSAARGYQLDGTRYTTGPLGEVYRVLAC